MSTNQERSAQPSPGGQGDQRSDLVPGIVRCAKCQFQLVRSNLNMYDGTVTAGDSKTEPCPNGCGPLWPVTWETWAREGWAEAERLHLENAALSAQPSRGGQDARELLAAEFDKSEVTAAAARRLRNHNETEAEAAALRVIAARQPVGEPVAYLDLGAGGYMDLGTDLSDEELAALPKGRHMLAIIGTYGVDGYKPAQAVDLAENMLSVLIEEGVLARNGRVFQKLRALIDSKAS